MSYTQPVIVPLGFRSSEISGPAGSSVQVRKTIKSKLSVKTIAIDGSGSTWIGTYGGGLAKFDGTNWTVYDTSNSGLPHNEVLSLAINGTGNKWIGTGGGLAKFDGANWTVYNTENSGLPSDVVYAIAVDKKGDIWVGAQDLTGEVGGLAKFDGANWTVYNTSNSGLPDNSVESIAIDGSGNKWIGVLYWGGLSVFNEEGIVAVKDKDKLKPEIPHSISLFQNYPITRVSFSTVKPSHITLTVFDIKGRALKTLVNNVKRAGNHQVNLDCRDMPNGTYFINLRVGNNAVTKKMVILK